MLFRLNVKEVEHVLAGRQTAAQAAIGVCAAAVETTFERGVACPYVATARRRGEDEARAIAACRRRVSELSAFHARGRERWCAPSG
eukprot:207603-Prymnesium_polylepis.1